MAKPPQSTPHSDIDGIHQDEEPNVETATKTGQTTSSLQRAHKEVVARPDYSEDRANKDDRTS